MEDGVEAFTNFCLMRLLFKIDKLVPLYLFASILMTIPVCQVVLELIHYHNRVDAGKKRVFGTLFVVQNYEREIFGLDLVPGPKGEAFASVLSHVSSIIRNDVTVKSC